MTDGDAKVNIDEFRSPGECAAVMAALRTENAALKAENIGLKRCEYSGEQALRIAELRIAKLKADVERLTPAPMTLFEVVRLFNTLNHLGRRDWFWEGDLTLAGFVSYGDRKRAIQAKEAVYIAQGLLRDAGRKGESS